MEIYHRILDSVEQTEKEAEAAATAYLAALEGQERAIRNYIANSDLFDKAGLREARRELNRILNKITTIKKLL